jgi:predicted ferric reductase
MRLTTRTLVVLGALLGIILVWSSDQILPASSAYQAQMRVWLIARAAGITAYLILTFVVAVGLLLSHPVNKSTWMLSKRIFPWHENLFMFTVAFTVGHIVSIVLDPWAGVGLAGALIPGLSSFRSVPVALGTLGLYGLLFAGLTARYTRALPRSSWLTIHRLSILIWAVTWGHGILSGTDTNGIGWLYIVTGLAILGATAYRYWVGKQGRPTFASSLPIAPRPKPAATDQAGTPRPMGPVEGARS